VIIIIANPYSSDDMVISQLGQSEGWSVGIMVLSTTTICEPRAHKDVAAAVAL